MPYQLDKFILFGDSITEYSNNQAGFALAPALQDLYSRKLDVVTRGFSGYNTDQGLVMMEEILKAEKQAGTNIKLMYIFMGTNDAANTFQKVPLDRYKSNLDRMIDMASSQVKNLILIGPALHQQHTVQKGFSSSKATRTYANAAKEVAVAHSVPFVDLWSAFQRESGWSESQVVEENPNLEQLLIDGIHYTPQGYKTFYNELIKVITASYPELLAENIKPAAPYYADMDYSDVKKSISDYLSSFK